MVLCVIGAISFIFGFKQFHKYSLIKDTPRSKIRSLAMGLVELHGVVAANETIQTPFSRSQCVYYQYRIEEYRMHTRTDSKGRTTVYYSWDTIASGSRQIPFFARDDTGDVYIDPRGAEYDVPLKKVFYQHRGGFIGAFSTILTALSDWDKAKTTEMDIGSWNLQPVKPGHITWGASVGDRKYYEHYLEPNENLFLMGTAVPDRGAPNNVLVRKGEDEPTFIISNKREAGVMKSLKWKMAGLLILACALEVIGVIVALLSADVSS
ncbi:MAG: hypothetical protein JSV49_03015 [Thermoplasmata archaeon]|nr:MAG: hypothetical protein JSV49_03015 [Thermoplasmata archaeon]